VYNIIIISYPSTKKEKKILQEGCSLPREKAYTRRGVSLYPEKKRIYMYNTIGVSLELIYGQ